MARSTKHILIVTILLFNLINICYANEAVLILKINQIDGHRFTSMSYNPKIIESTFKSGLEDKNFEVYSSKEAIEESQQNIASREIYYADVFLYQAISANCAAISILIRKNEGVIYGLKNCVPMIGDMQTETHKTAKELVKEVPNYNTIKDFTAEIKIYHLMPSTKSNITGLNKKPFKFQIHSIKMEFEKENTLKFVYGKTIENYLNQFVSFAGFSNKVRGKQLKIFIDIDEYGYTHFKGLAFPKKVKDYQKKRFQEMIKTIPLWKNEDQQAIKATIIIERSMLRQNGSRY